MPRRGRSFRAIPTLLVAMTLLDDSGSASAAEPEVRPNTGVLETRMRIHPDTDCNGNGIPDRKDRALGSIEDFNQNGLDDNCDRDTSMAALLSSGWRSVTIGSDPYFAVIYVPSRRQILINYVLPRSSQQVRIVATRMADNSYKVLRTGREPKGPHTFSWEPKAQDGTQAPAGHWRLALVVDESSYYKTAVWNWPALSPPQ